MSNDTNYYLKNFIYNFAWWSFFVVATVGIIQGYDSLERWKYGYFTVDWIPSLMIYMLLYMISVTVRINRLYRIINQKEVKHDRQT